MMNPLDDAPAAVVKRQLDAYNRKDLEGWLATYAPAHHGAHRQSTLTFRQ